MTERRRLLLALPALAAPALLAGRARAQGSWSPNRAVTVLVGFAPGGGADIVSRLLATRLQEEMGVPIAVENRPGASGTLATSAVARARPDGQTLVIGTISTQAVVPPLMSPPPYDVLGDLTPLMRVGTVPQVAVVPANSPARTLAELIAIAKQRPGELNFASSGIGSSQHLAAELLCREAGVRMSHVPYRGTGQAVNDLIAGRVDLNMDTLPTNLPHIRSGGLRALAVTTPARTPSLPEVPTVAEQGFPGFDSVTWYMAAGPANLPPAIKSRWAQALSSAVNHPDTNARMVELGYIPGTGGPDEAVALVRADSARYGELARQINLRFE